MGLLMVYRCWWFCPHIIKMLETLLQLRYPSSSEHHRAMPAVASFFTKSMSKISLNFMFFFFFNKVKPQINMLGWSKTWSDPWNFGCYQVRFVGNMMVGWQKKNVVVRYTTTRVQECTFKVGLVNAEPTILPWTTIGIHPHILCTNKDCQLWSDHQLSFLTKHI